MSVSSPHLIGFVRGPRPDDEVGARAFVAALHEAVAVGCERVLVDLAACERVTTLAINALLQTRQHLLGRGGSVVVLVSDRQRRTLELLGLDRRFQLSSDRDRAADLLSLPFPGDRGGEATARAS